MHFTKNIFNQIDKQNLLILLIILWNIFSAILIGFLDFPRLLLYVTDILNLVLFIITFINNKINKNTVIKWIVLFSIIALLSSLINGVSLLLVLWGIRQNFRFFIFFYACTIALKENSLKLLINVVAVVFWISLPLCYYECMRVDYPVGTIIGDMVGGIYYQVGSANEPLNIILCLYSTYTIIRYLDGKVSIIRLLLVLCAGLLMATFAEIKLFIIEVVIILIVSICLSKRNKRAALLISVCLVMLYFAIDAFVLINARGKHNYTREMFSVESLWKYASRSEGYDGHGDLNRLTAISQINKYIFEDNDYLLGYGLGSAEYSKSLDIITSEFYKRYSDLHYQYFSQSFVFIETGLLGLISYVMIFVSALLKALFRWKNAKWRSLYIVLTLLMIFLIICNTTMRNEFCAYMLYLILALPFCKKISD